MAINKPAETTIISACPVKIPTFFYQLTEYLSFEKYNELPARALAAMVFGYDFTDEQDAWKAIKFAEAISYINQIDEIDHDLSDEELYELFDRSEIRVGISALTAQAGTEPMDKVKTIIEEHFSDPMSHTRLFLLRLNNQ